MKIYLVKRIDNIGWDEYDSFVVIAETPNEAIKTCNDLHFIRKNVKVREVKLTNRAKIVLGSFRAG